MIFNKAIEPIMKLLQNNGLTYLNSEWVGSYLEDWFDSSKPKKKEDKIYELVSTFVKENLVEAPTSEILRLSIMQYTLGYFVRDLVYKNRFRNNPKDYGIYNAHSKLSFANALIQWKLMCEQLGFDWDEMLALGKEHLEERYKDFMKDGWAKL